MQKARRALAQVAGRFLFIGISVQILLGFGWMFRSFGLFPEFGDSLRWLAAADTLVCDDYMGIGYPLFLMLTKGIESISSIPYTFFVYILQILFAFYSGFTFLRSFEVTEKKAFLCWGSLGLLTLSGAMQCHLAVLPNSIGYSCLLMELAVIIRILRENPPKMPIREMFFAGIWWILSTLFVAENRYLGAVPLVILWIRHLCRVKILGKQRILQELVLLAAMTGILFTVAPMWQTPGSYGRAENTVSAAMMRRFTWTHMRDSEEYEEWPEELQSYLSWDEVKRAGYYAGTMQSGIQKTLEDRLGKQEAEKVFRQYAAYGLKTYFSDNIHQIVWDVAGYTLPPVLLQLFLDGRGYDSFSGRNVDIMMTGDPRLTEVLLKYSSWWFLMGIATTVITEIFCGIPAKLWKKDRAFRQILFVLVITSGGMILWYVMGDAGCLDYKNGLLPGSLWLAGMILSISRFLKSE